MSDADNNRHENKMRTIRTKVYKFSELSKEAQEKAIDSYRANDNNTEFVFAWDAIYEDAKEIGLKIISLDDHIANKGEFIYSAQDTAKKILANHGEICDTYKTAQTFISECEAIQQQAEKEGKDGDEDYWFSDEIEELEEEFLRSLLEDYRIMYNRDIEYQNSDEAIKETIEANEYEFYANGKMI